MTLMQQVWLCCAGRSPGPHSAYIHTNNQRRPSDGGNLLFSPDSLHMGTTLVRAEYLLPICLLSTCQDSVREPYLVSAAQVWQSDVENVARVFTAFRAPSPETEITALKKVAPVSLVVCYKISLSFQQGLGLRGYGRMSFSKEL